MKGNIKMVDLSGQYEKIKDEINKAIQDVIETTSFIKGPDVKIFRDNLQKYLGGSYVTPCANGTDALQVAMMALDLQPGDEVITTPFTFISTVEVIKLLKLRPVLVDIDDESFNINADKIEDAITSKTKAIVPVHLFGQCADMNKILDISQRKGLFVIEDTAQAMGAEFYHNDGSTTKAGTLGHIGTTSFFPSKNLGAYGDGGAIFTSDKVLSEKISAIVNHGMSRRYYHDYVGVNSRLDTIQAAILTIKLKYLDDYNRERQISAAYYDDKLMGHEHISIPHRVKFSNHIFHQYTLKINNDSRDDLKLFLQDQGIPSMIYYPIGLHLQQAYGDLGYKKGDFPVTEDICRKVLSIPMHTELKKKQQKFITKKILEFFNQ